MTKTCCEQSIKGALQETGRPDFRFRVSLNGNSFMRSIAENMTESLDHMPLYTYMEYIYCDGISYNYI